MSTHYEIFEASAMQLAATLVLKDVATCEIINSRLTALGKEVDPQNPASWKYYLNISGQYHYTDTPMTIVSNDDETVIDFTVANMNIHRRTWREYQYGSRYYDELLAKYPRQQMLIDGILNPVDINEAIAAPDHSILYYDPSLVEGRETNLIYKLQEWINGLFIRWANDDYRINNSLFIAARLKILFMGMPDEILNIRLANCRTHMAHSYHIRRYLASFGPLDDYYAAMNEFQRLYFYRDIRYINNNNGKDEMFQELTQNVMTKRKLPLADYTMQQNDAVIPDQIDPTIQFMRRSLNGIPSALGEDIKTNPQLLQLQRKLARSNEDEIPYAEIYVPEVMERNLASEVKTKVLESNVLDLKESEPYTLAEVLLNQWIYLADKGLYTNILSIVFPEGGDATKLTMKEAWILYVYVYFKRSGWDLIEIPKMMAKRVRRMPLPTFEELRGICSREFVDDAFIHEALKNNVNITKYVSVDGFANACYEIQQRMLLHRDLYVYRNDFYQYGEIKQMTDRFYADIPVDMDNGQNYAAWLAARNLSMEKYTPNELDEILQNILSQATGKDLRITQNLKEIHTAMLGIMSQLSSYSIQFIQQINEEAVVMFDWPHLRWHDQGGHSADEGRLNLGLAKPTDLGGIGHEQGFQDISNTGIVDFESYTKHQDEIIVGLDFEMSGKKEFISKGMIIGAMVAALDTPSVDLATKLTGQRINAYKPIETRPIAELFQKVTADEFSAP